MVVFKEEVRKETHDAPRESGLGSEERVYNENDMEEDTEVELDPILPRREGKHIPLGLANLYNTSGIFPRRPT